MRGTIVRNLARRSSRGGGGSGGGARGRQEELTAEEAERSRQIIELLRPMPRPPPRSEEERARLRELMIKYGKLKRRQHISRELKAQEFLRAKWTAIDALPHARKVEAFAQPAEDFPANRPLFTHTPPIPGFNAGEMTKKSK